MKTGIIAVIAVAIVAVVAYFAYLQFAVKAEQAPVTNGTPAPSYYTNGKLNIDAVCNGALAYMTFPSSVEADAFVQECKEGKHPEVIEKYKADMHLDGTTI